MPEASTGFEFLEKVVQWMNQDLNDKLPTRHQYADDKNSWRVNIQAEDNYTTWLLNHDKINPMNSKSVPYFAVNLMLAKSMGCLVEKSSNVYKVGPNLLMELPNEYTSTKPYPATCLNAKFTFTKPIHVVDGLLYLCSTFNWRFVHLNEEFKQATTHVFGTPRTQTNVFKQWMTDISLWRMSSGLELDDSIVELPVSSLLEYQNSECYAVGRSQDCRWSVERCL